jgi:two-component system response regulator AtoC
MNGPAHILELTADPSFVFGHGKTLASLNAAVVEIARTNIPVLLLGESGTGKEVYARLVHRLSGSSDAPLRKVSCSVIDPAQLLRQFEADSHALSSPPLAGSLFLDNVDELDSACQRALLSLLSDSENRQRLAARSTRLISSSSQDLEPDVKAGLFRKELYFRINGVCLRLPPLRERREDIGSLLEQFLQKYALDLNRTAPALGQGTMETLKAYDWPGNIRELENLARKMVALGNTESALDDMRNNRPELTRSPKIEMSHSLKNAARAASRQKERELILEALERTKWNRKRAARELQISYKALLYKLKQIG